jgi:hypothetical protein
MFVLCSCDIRAGFETALRHGGLCAGIEVATTHRGVFPGKTEWLLERYPIKRSWWLGGAWEA